MPMRVLNNPCNDQHNVDLIGLAEKVCIGRCTLRKKKITEENCPIGEEHNKIWNGKAYSFRPLTLKPQTYGQLIFKNSNDRD